MRRDYGKTKDKKPLQKQRFSKKNIPKGRKPGSAQSFLRSPLQFAIVIEPRITISTVVDVLPLSCILNRTTPIPNHSLDGAFVSDTESVRNGSCGSCGSCIEGCKSNPSSMPKNQSLVYPIGVFSRLKCWYYNE